MKYSLIRFKNKNLWIINKNILYFVKYVVLSGFRKLENKGKNKWFCFKKIIISYYWFHNIRKINNKLIRNVIIFIYFIK
jgi:hypothetical protein